MFNVLIARDLIPQSISHQARAPVCDTLEKMTYFNVSKMHYLAPFVKALRFEDVDVD
jgi:hypothetical protein